MRTEGDASELVKWCQKIPKCSELLSGFYQHILVFFTSKMMSGHVFLVGIPLSQNPKGNPTQVGTQVWSSPTKKPETIPIDFSGLKFVCSWFGVLSFWGNLGGWKATNLERCIMPGQPVPLPNVYHPPQKQGFNKALKGNQWSVLS